MFDTAIEGFSRIKKVSSEGRAAMTMDLFALHEGLNNIHLCRPPRGKHYIDFYLRTAYMSEDDVLKWVQENWQSYAYRHVLGLISQTFTSVMNGRKLKDAVATIDQLYESENRDVGTNNKFSNLISQRLRDESKLSSMISQRLRGKT